MEKTSRLWLPLLRAVLLIHLIMVSTNGAQAVLTRIRHAVSASGQLMIFRPEDAKFPAGNPLGILDSG